MEHLSQILGNAFHATFMGVYHRWFAERVGGQLSRGMDDALGMLDEIAVGGNVVCVVRHHVKQIIITLQRFLVGVLLQDDEVTAHFRVGILRKEVVGQADS